MPEDLEKSDLAYTVPATLSAGEDADTAGSFDWGNTAALGTLSLALHKDDLEKKAAEKVTNAITDAADVHLGREEQQGYGQPYAQSKLSYADDDTGYVWGSNSFVADNAVILAAAYDLTGEQNYLNGVISAMDYLLGRNPMDVSYITGCGSHAVQYPHHRLLGAPDLGGVSHGAGWRFSRRAELRHARSVGTGQRVGRRVRSHRQSATWTTSKRGQ
ncbi:MAG: glycoside hydrolase family 9 protein [Ruminococcus sp.]